MSPADAAAAPLLERVVDALARIAPEVRDAPPDPRRPLREQLELDSMDHLRFLVVLHERFGVDVPESEYGRLRTLEELVAWLQARGVR